jgi:hypothetical protein
MFLTLFENGEYRISNNYRLINEPNTAEWYADIQKNLSSMIQFSKGQRSNTEISTAYFAGVTADQMAALQASPGYPGVDSAELNLRENLDIGGKAAGKTDFNPGDYLFNIGNLLKQTR